MPGPTSILDTKIATSQGGRAGGKIALTGDGGGSGRLYLHMEHAKGLGGSGEGTTPEQLLALGWSACFNSAVLFVAGQQKIDASKAKVNVAVSIGRDADNKFALAAKITLHLPGADPAKAKEIIEAAHQVCPFSSATRGNVPVELAVEG